MIWGVSIILVEHKSSSKSNNSNVASQFPAQTEYSKSSETSTIETLPENLSLEELKQALLDAFNCLNELQKAFTDLGIDTQKIYNHDQFSNEMMEAFDKLPHPLENLSDLQCLKEWKALYDRLTPHTYFKFLNLQRTMNYKDNDKYKDNEQSSQCKNRFREIMGPSYRLLAEQFYRNNDLENALDLIWYSDFNEKRTDFLFKIADRYYQDNNFKKVQEILERIFNRRKKEEFLATHPLTDVPD